MLHDVAIFWTVRFIDQLPLPPATSTILHLASTSQVENPGHHRGIAQARGHVEGRLPGATGQKWRAGGLWQRKKKIQPLGGMKNVWINLNLWSKSNLLESIWYLKNR